MTDPSKLIGHLVATIEEAEKVRSASGAQKKAYVVEAARALADRTLAADEARVVNALAPHIIDAVVAASKGLIAVNDDTSIDTACRCTIT